MDATSPKTTSIPLRACVDAAPGFHEIPQRLISRLEREWDMAQASRDRDAIYQYLAAPNDASTSFATCGFCEIKSRKSFAAALFFEKLHKP